MISDPGYANPFQAINAALARAFAPRKPLAVSEWADLHRQLSRKGSARHGQWRTAANPPLREPMDALSARNPVPKFVCTDLNLRMPKRSCKRFSR